MKLTEKQRFLFSNILKVLREADDEDDWDYEVNDDITDDDLNDDGSNYTDLLGDEDLAKKGWEKTDRKDGTTNVPDGSKYDNPDYWGHDVFVKHGENGDKYRSRWQISNDIINTHAAYIEPKTQGVTRGLNRGADKELYAANNGDDAAYIDDYRADYMDLPYPDMPIDKIDRDEYTKGYDRPFPSEPHEIDVPEDAKWFD